MICAMRVIIITEIKNNIALDNTVKSQYENQTIQSECVAGLQSRRRRGQMVYIQTERYRIL